MILSKCLFGDKNRLWGVNSESGCMSKRSYLSALGPLFQWASIIKIRFMVFGLVHRFICRLHGIVFQFEIYPLILAKSISRLLNKSTLLSVFGNFAGKTFSNFQSFKSLFLTKNKKILIMEECSCLSCSPLYIVEGYWHRIVLQPWWYRGWSHQPYTVKILCYWLYRQGVCIFPCSFFLVLFWSFYLASFIRPSLIWLKFSLDICVFSQIIILVLSIMK